MTEGKAAAHWEAMGWSRVGAAVLVLASVGTGRAMTVGEVADSPGAALRRALDAQERNQLPEAAQALAQIAQRYPVVADYAGWLEARARLAAGDAQGAAAAATRALERKPDSPILASLYHALGDARSALEQEDAARAAWESGLSAAEEEEERAALRLAIARSHERTGQLEAAAREYRELWARLPLQPEAEEATRRLDTLEKEESVPPRGAVDFLKRADALFAAHRSAESLEAYDRALRGTLSADEDQRAREQKARALFRLRRYREAAEAFQALGKQRKARLWYARSLARSGKVESAIREFETLASEAKGPEGRRAHLLAGLLLEDKEQYERALAHYAALAKQKRQPALAAVALWRLGWAAYRQERYSDAREHFSQLAARLDDPLARLRARYWAARALAPADPTASRAELEGLARVYPFSYYGWRASQHVGADGEAPAVPTPIPRGRAAIPEREMVRPRILLEAGLPEAALQELRQLGSRARGLEDRLRLARLHSDAGDFHGAERLLVDAYAESLARGPVAGFEELWWLAWPDAYGELVDRAVPSDARIETELIYAVMREESGYRPEVVSAAGALGLLQIMPETGERLARQVGLAQFSPQDLFTPRINLRLGGFYLDHLTRRFEGKLSAAIAGYNAGPEVVARWIESAPVDDDQWVESIPYPQTRSYVRRVLRSLQIYRALY